MCEDENKAGDGPLTSRVSAGPKDSYASVSAKYLPAGLAVSGR